MKYIFISCAIILALMIIIFKLYIQKLQRTEKISGYVSIISWAFALYVISALILVFFIQGAINKFIVLLFALSPFIIGKYATYQKENVYSLIQIFCAIISAGYVLYI